MQAPPILEEMTRSNLSATLMSLMDGEGGCLNVNDKMLTGVLRIRVSFRGPMGDAVGG